MGNPCQPAGRLVQGTLGVRGRTSVVSVSWYKADSGGRPPGAGVGLAGQEAWKGGILQGTHWQKTSVWLCVGGWEPRSKALILEGGSLEQG